MATNNKYYDYFGSFLPGNATHQPPGTGTTLYPSNLLALLSDEGNVLPTQTAGKVRFDLNAILDAPSGIMSYDGAGVRFYEKSEADTKLATAVAGLMSLIQGGGGTQGLETHPSLHDWFKIGEGMSLVAGGVDTWTGIKGNVVAAPSSTQRPTYFAAGGANNTPYMHMSGGAHLVGGLNLNTQDLLVVLVVRIPSPGSWQTLTRFGNGDWFGLKTWNGGLKMTSQGNVNYSESELYPCPVDTWMKVEAKSWRSLASGEAIVKVNGVSSTMTIDSDNSALFANDVFVIGQDLGGYVSDVLVFDKKLIAADQTLLDLTLNGKFGL